LRRPSLVAGKSVIELGAGCGFASIVAARLAESILVTDRDAETVLNLRHNLVKNASYWLQDRPSRREPLDVGAERLDWDVVVSKGWPPLRRVDAVIGSDIIYGNWGATVAKVAERLLYPSGTMVMISAEDRGGLPDFEQAMVKAGFSVDQSYFYDEDKRFLLYICGPGRPCISRHITNN
jgi:predicted nicotinamide N-methyase